MEYIRYSWHKRLHGKGNLVTRRLVLLLVGFLALGLPARADLDDDYRNRQEVIRLLHSADDGSLQPNERLQRYDKALTLDPDNQEAALQKGQLLLSQGRLTEAAAAFARCVSVGEANSYAARAETALVSICLTLKRPDDALFWASRRLVDDPRGQYGSGDALLQIADIRAAQGHATDAAWALGRYLDLTGPNAKLTERYQALLSKAQVGGTPAARLLFPSGRIPKPASRDILTVLMPVALPADAAVAEPLGSILADPRGRYFILLPRDISAYYIINLTVTPLEVKKVAAPAPIVCAALAQGEFYAVLDHPARLTRLDIRTGKVLAAFPLNTPAPTSLAVFPTWQAVFFPNNGAIYRLNLLAGQVTRTDLPGDVVAASPFDDILFALAKPGALPLDALAVPSGENQSMLVKALVLPDSVLLAEMRAGAAVDGRQIVCGADGNWLAVLGEGGYHPGANGGRGGDGAAVFAAADIGVCQGFFAASMPINGLMINPVTGQVIVTTPQDARVYHLTEPLRYVPLRGKGFSGVGAWSGNGRYLALASEAGGLTVYANTRTDEEIARGESWWKDLKDGGPFGNLPGPRPPSRLPGQPEELAVNFLLTGDRQLTLMLLDRALARWTPAAPLHWQEAIPVADETKAALSSLSERLRHPDDRDKLLADLKKLLDAHPDDLPAWYALAQALRVNGGDEDADTVCLELVHHDGGRTDLTVLALQDIAAHCLTKKKSISALACLALAFDLDRNDARTRALLLPLLDGMNLPDYAAALR